MTDKREHKQAEEPSDYNAGLAPVKEERGGGGIEQENLKLQCSSEKFCDRLIGSSTAKMVYQKSLAGARNSLALSPLSKFSHWPEAVTSWRECSLRMRYSDQKLWPLKAFTQLQLSHQVLLKVYPGSVGLRPPHKLWNRKPWGAGGGGVDRNNSNKAVTNTSFKITKYRKKLKNT